jgi:hypothetical protein
MPNFRIVDEKTSEEAQENDYRVKTLEMVMAMETGFQEFGCSPALEKHTSDSKKGEQECRLCGSLSGWRMAITAPASCATFSL